MDPSEGYLDGGFKDFLFSPRNLGEDSILTSIFFKWLETTNELSRPYPWILPVPGMFSLTAESLPGRSMTGEELKAAAGNPQLGLSRHLRGGRWWAAAWRMGSQDITQVVSI